MSDLAEIEFADNTAVSVESFRANRAAYRDRPIAYGRAADGTRIGPDAVKRALRLPSESDGESVTVSTAQTATVARTRRNAARDDGA